MDTKIKNYLTYAIILTLAIFSYAIVVYVKSYSKSIEPSSFRSFSASGEGKTISIPDVAQFTFNIITEGGKDIAKLQKENTDKANKAIAFVKSKGVEAKDIKTQNYNLNPRYQYYSCNPRTLDNTEVKPCPPPENVGYTINQSEIDKIRDFSKIGDIIGGVVESGANSVSQLSFAIDDLAAVKNQAREDAIKKAKESAKLIAKAGGFEIGRLLSIEESGYTPQPVYYQSIKNTFSAGASEMASPAIEAGSQEITVNVNLRYEIE